jgi:hypothetical protein
MAGIVTRLGKVLCWLGESARRGELKPLLKWAVVLTARDLRFFLQLIWARLLVRFEVGKRRAQQESLKREAETRSVLRRLAKKPPVKNGN